MAHTSARRRRAVWDRPATGTRLLLWPKPVPVSLGCSIDPLRISLIASAPSRPTCPPRPRAADARVPSPRMITHGSYPQRACPTTVDARVLSRMNSRSALLGVEADARVLSRMNSRSAHLGAEADACGIAPRMISRTATLAAEADARALSRMNSRSALPGVEADACANPQMTSRALTLRVAARAAEGALATLILTLSLSLSPSPFRWSHWPVALGWGRPFPSLRSRPLSPSVIPDSDRESRLPTHPLHPQESGRIACPTDPDHSRKEIAC